jgi:hypothetical protein
MNVEADKIIKKYQYGLKKSSQIKHNGSYCARSKKIGSSSRSRMILTTIEKMVRITTIKIITIHTNNYNHYKNNNHDDSNDNEL